MSFFDDPPLRDFPDHALRRLLENPANLRDLVAARLPDLVERMDFTRAEYEPREFLMEDWRKRECDLFVRVPYHTGQGEDHVLICILVEHQSSPDPRMPLRTLVYAASYWEREWKEWELRHNYGQLLVLTPILPIVFYTGSTEWNSGLQFVDQFPDVPELRAFVPQWSPLLWDLSAQDPAALLSSASAWLRTLTIVRTEEEEFGSFEIAFKQVCRSLDELHRTERMRSLDLLWFVISWVLRRRPRTEEQRLRQDMRESLTVEATQREVEAMASKLGDTLEDIVRRDEKLRTARRYLRKVIEARFGTIPEILNEQVNDCQDINRLDAWVDQALRTETLEELLREWSVG